MLQPAMMITPLQPRGRTWPPLFDGIHSLRWSGFSGRWIGCRAADVSLRSATRTVGVWVPEADIEQTEEATVYKFDLPGIASDHVM